MGIISLNFTLGNDHPKNFSDAINLFAGPAMAGTRRKSQSLISPWNFLVIDSKDQIASNLVFYRSFFESVNVPRMILIVDDSQGDVLEHVQLPALFEQHQQRIRIILMSSLTGCVWDVRSVQPDGICSWSDIDTGSSNLSAIADSLTIPEVFEAVFNVTEGRGADVWSIGTKQVWFGTIDHQALADAFQDVGSELLGDDARVAILRRLSPWIDDIGVELLGNQYEDDILEQGGTARKWFTDISSRAKQAHSAFGMGGWRLGILDRIAGFPSRQVSALDRVSGALLNCEEQVRSLMVTIDASDGFQKGEINRFRADGIQLNRQDDSRIETYRGSDIKVLEAALFNMDASLDEGYSLATVRSELEELIQLIAPRTIEEILNGKKAEGIRSGVEASLGFEDVSLKELQATVSNSARGGPKNPLVYFGRWVARLLQNMTFRVVGSLLYLWLLLVFLFETLELADTIPSLVPTPSSARATGRLIMTVLLIALSLLSFLFGVCITYAAMSIQKWGRASGLIRVDEAVEINLSFFKRIALNDWVLWAFRDQAARYLRALDKSLENLGTVVRETFIDVGQTVGAEPQAVLPNPLVRKTGGELASAAWFLQMNEIKKMLKTEVISLVRHHYRIGTPEFRTERCDQIAIDLANDLRQPLSEYVSRLQHDGVLHLDNDMTINEKEIREKLAAKYWGDFEELRTSLTQVVEIEPLDPLVQFIRSEDIMRIDRGNDRTVVVPFSPEPSRRLVGDSERGSSEITFTQSTELAGVIRLTPFRNEQFSYVATDSEG